MIQFPLNWCPQSALLDADNVLARNKRNIRAIFNQAESLYSLSQFEHAMLQFHKGQVFKWTLTLAFVLNVMCFSIKLLIPENQDFEAGILKCKKTILNCITDDIFVVSHPLNEIILEFVNFILIFWTVSGVQILHKTSRRWEYKLLWRYRCQLWH